MGRGGFCEVWRSSLAKTRVTGVWEVVLRRRTVCACGFSVG